MSQNCLADKANMDRGTMSRTLTGKRNPTLAELRSMASVLEMQVGKLINGTEFEELHGVQDDLITAAELESKGLRSEVAQLNDALKVEEAKALELQSLYNEEVEKHAKTKHRLGKAFTDKAELESKLNAAGQYIRSQASQIEAQQKKLKTLGWFGIGAAAIATAAYLDEKNKNAPKRRKRKPRKT